MSLYMKRTEFREWLRRQELTFENEIEVARISTPEAAYIQWCEGYGDACTRIIRHATPSVTDEELEEHLRHGNTYPQYASGAAYKVGWDQAYEHARMNYFQQASSARD